MRKFKLIATAVLASALMLSGCDKEQEPEEPEHSHVDANNDYVCDECGEVLTGVESVSIVCEDSVAEKEQIELKANVKVHGVAKDVSWSVVNGTGTAEIVTEEGKTYLKGLTVGTVTVKATSTVDSSKYSEKVITVYTKGFAPGLIDLGFTYSTSFPVAELKAMFGDEATIFEPSEEITSRGLYFIHQDKTETSAENFLIIYNLDASKALEDPEVARIGSKLDSEYYGAEYLYSFSLEDNNVGFIDNTFTYEFDTSFISSFYSMYWYRVSDLFYDETKTENVDWTEEEKAEMKGMLDGNEIPFIKMGAKYDFDTSFMGGYINFYDGCCDYRISEEYKTLLVQSGFEYLENLDVFAKKLEDNKYLYVEVFFDEYGNEIYAFVGPEILYSWPTEVVDNFTSSVLESENTVPAFDYESDTKTYSFGQEPTYLEVQTSYAKYDDIEAYVNNLINEHGFKLVGTTDLVTIFLEDPTTAEGKFGGFRLQKGYIELYITINPEYKPDSVIGAFPAEFYFDYCDIHFQISHSGGYEEKGIYIDNKKHLSEGEKLKLELGSEFELSIVECKLSEEAVITAEASNGVVSVTNSGVITPNAIGESTITFTAVDEGVTYVSSIDVVVEYKEVTEYSSISEHADELSSEGKFTFAESEVECVVSKGEGEDYELDSQSGTLTLKEGNSISFTAPENQALTFVGFDYAESSDAVVSPSVGEFVKDGWYATQDENTVTLTVTSGTYTISDLKVMTNASLLPVPSLSTAKSLAHEIADQVVDWWMTESADVDDDDPTYCTVSFIWTEYIPSDSGFSIEEAYDSCVSYQIILMPSENFELDYDITTGVDEDGNEYATGYYYTENYDFMLSATVTVDSATDQYFVECVVMEF